MALTIRILQRNWVNFQKITKPVKFCNAGNHVRILANGICYENNVNRPLFGIQSANTPKNLLPKFYSTKDDTGKLEDPPQKPPGLIQKFKQMYRDYWYVLVPVHIATSAVWFGSLYYAVRSGVDVIGLLEYIGVSETIITPLKESSAGYFALAFALYKLMTPLRYAVTVGGTTIAIKRLTAFGLIRPVPSRERIKEMLQEKKDNLQDKFQESKQHYQTQMREKSSHVMEEMRRYKEEMRNMKNKVKKM